MTTEPSTESVRELFSATSALLLAMKEEDEPTDLQPYIEAVEDALQGIEDETGWDAEVRTILEGQIKAAGMSPQPPENRDRVKLD